MEKILFVNACIRPMSRTMVLAKHALSKLEGDVEELNLEAERIQPHNWERLQKRDALLSSESFDDPMFRYARQFRDADTIVIAAPYYDLSFPASLKCWVESICNVGLTFYYDDQNQPQTLCKGKRLIYVTTSGAEFIPDFGFGYIRRVFSEFFHIEDAVCFHAEKLDLPGKDVEACLARAADKIDMYFAR